jgi:A/G-specific adenine glycosylase
LITAYPYLQSDHHMAFSNKKRQELRQALLSWYNGNSRDLPWRHTRDPYRIWVSEVMLQQTRVAVVIDRYRQFLERFPTIGVLARSRESAVLAEWSGLGYYRRARNLRSAAKVVVRDHSGAMPSSADALRKLAGIGRYTAAAIASIAFNEATVVVDGNVERVLTRLHGRGLAGGRTWAAAQELLDVERPGDFNQAMMELGATVCLPAMPRCVDCPVRKFCRTRGRGQIRKGRPRQQRREIAYLLARRGKSVLLVRRAADHGLMPNMWELPNIQLRKNNVRAIIFSVSHSITATNYTVHVVGPRTGAARSDHNSGTWVSMARISHIPLTGLARKILRRAEII